MDHPVSIWEIKIMQVYGWITVRGEHWELVSQTNLP